MKKILLVLILTLSISCNNDDEAGTINVNCTEVFVNGLSVTVKDAQTDVAITDGITVIATDGDYTETLQLVNDVFTGAGERAGTYSITATGIDYIPSTVNQIVVDEDECHVITEQVTLTLMPS